jgi:hypothetical protein
MRANIMRVKIRPAGRMLEGQTHKTQCQHSVPALPEVLGSWGKLGKKATGTPFLSLPLTQSGRREGSCSGIDKITNFPPYMYRSGSWEVGKKVGPKSFVSNMFRTSLHFRKMPSTSLHWEGKGSAKKDYF